MCFPVRSLFLSLFFILLFVFSFPFFSHSSLFASETVDSADSANLVDSTSQANPTNRTAEYFFEKTRSEGLSFEGLRLQRGDETVWELHFDAPEGKPFIAPMRLPDGRDATLLRPKDHVWHLGIWFSWKYLNGVNYWEPSSGKTIVRNVVSSVENDSAKVEIQIDYVDQNKPETVVLREERTIVFSKPDAKGAYSIEFFHRFVAQNQDVVLDRTPPHPHGGGYAGLALRLSPIFGTFETHCANGEIEMRTIREKPADWIEYCEPETGTGLRLTILKGTPETRFYAQKTPSYCLINPCPVMTEPRTIKVGEPLELAYRLDVF